MIRHNVTELLHQLTLLPTPCLTGYQDLTYNDNGKLFKLHDLTYMTTAQDGLSLVLAISLIQLFRPFENPKIRALHARQ